jgi:hypothetical protein
MIENMCQIKFAFDLPDVHPLAELSIDDIWTRLEAIKFPAEFCETDDSGCKTTIVFQTYDLENVTDIIKKTASILDSMD